MDISVLQLYVDVVQQGSFAAVARAHNIDPSSVSRAIAKLEAELGIRLLQRTTRQLSPTEAGMAYFERIEPLMQEMQQAIAIASEVTGQLQGVLRVTASVAFGLQRIVPLLPEFEQTYPKLTVELLLTDTNLDLVAERVDLAVRLGLLQDSTLIGQRLMQTHYFVCASPSYIAKQGAPAQPIDITAHNCLLFPLAGFRSRWRFRDSQGETVTVAVQGNTVISNAIGLQQCVIAGMGIALLPNWLIQADLHSGRLVNLFPDYGVTATDFDTAAWLVYPSRAYVPSKVRIFIDFLRRSLANSSI
ncbi:LysR family transcriptional regulator [filamentous cyanobacterium LEGE 11480]|uniref:LysR family transcriptional regulator n=1 Tax=Romeriopsis navalis LEGE 11480 TaxID=2777977 RepID=A0A928VQP6_9CYAN|nr:LysR family transcriptional regulator [Romeriopsis navalis]MBE9031992.1 LysR family transcriptional regulator [Romeriopsis navalis LEGE 11480]